MGQHIGLNQKKKSNTLSKSETKSRKTKLVNLNTTRDQPRNYPLARPGTKGTSSLQHAAARAPPGHGRDT